MFPARRRNPTTVQDNYDNERDRERMTFEISKPDLDTYVFGDPSGMDFGLVDDQVVYGAIQEPRRRVLEAIESRLRPFLQNNRGTIVEFGSGNGRNLIALKKKYPAASLVGFELSPRSVLLARQAADYFELDIGFYEANTCGESLPSLPKDVAACFSCHALEQMPRIFPRAVENMLKLTRFEVLMLEPVVELYPRNIRGTISRWRALSLDRLIGLIPYLEQRGIAFETERLKNADNPLNETCIVQIHKTPDKRDSKRQ